MQIEYQIAIEEAYPSFIIRRVYQMVYVEKPNKHSRRKRYESRLNDHFSQFFKQMSMIKFIQ